MSDTGKDPVEIPESDSSAVASGKDAAPLAAADVGADDASPSGEAPAGAGEGSVDPTPAPSPDAGADGADGKSAATKKDWKDDRIRVLTAKLREAQKAPEAASDAGGDGKLTEAEVQRRVEVLAAQNDFNRRCNDAAENGRKSFTDFDAKIGQLQQLVTPGDPAEAAAYTRLVEATLETGGDAPRLLYELGNDPEQALKLMQMSPVRLGLELAKLAAKRGEPEPSKAAKPVNPVGARGRANDEIDPADPTRADNLSGRSWIERRQRDIDARRKAGERVW